MNWLIVLQQQEMNEQTAITKAPSSLAEAATAVVQQAGIRQHCG
jgi:hypothetical protein